jgi:hypothetical protein
VGKLPKLLSEATLRFLSFCRCGMRTNKREESRFFAPNAHDGPKWIAVMPYTNLERGR